MSAPPRCEAQPNTATTTAAMTIRPARSSVTPRLRFQRPPNTGAKLRGSLAGHDDSRAPSASSACGSASPRLYPHLATRGRQVRRTNVQSLFWLAMVTPTVEDARRVALIAVGEERQSPGVLVPEIAKPAEVHREISATLEVFLTCFAQPSQLPWGRRVRLDEGVDVAQCA